MNPRKLTKFLQHRAGDQFWGLVYYSAEGATAFHVHEELPEQALVAQAKQFAAQDDPNALDVADDLPLFEHHRASLRYFQHSLVLHLWTDATTGVVAVFDLSVAPDSWGFIQRCMEIATTADE